MTDLDPLSAQRVIEADSERVDQALWLAYCALGPEPDFKTRRKAHVAYVKVLRKRALEIFSRAN
jgi:hypothetical protein